MKRKMHAGAGKFLYQRARELRDKATHAENILWGYLRTKPHGVKFRRQHPYAIYILDFYCHSLKLVIEVDGSIHFREDIKENDIIRQKGLEDDGLQVLRFTNAEVEKHLENVIVKIEEFILSNKMNTTDNNITPLSNADARPSPSGDGGGDASAMIFSAGLGTRFKPWTDKHPKALAVINGKSLLQRNIEYLRQYGIKEVIVNVHHFADQIEEAVRENNGWGSNVTISDERDAVLETGGGLLHAKHLFKPGERFITCNADILTDLDINKLLAFHEKEKSLISFAVSNRKTSRNLLFDENNMLCGWRNNTSGEERIAVAKDNLVARAYDCVVVFEYEVFDHIRFTGKFSLIDLYLDLAKTHKIAGFDHRGDRWVDVGKPESVAVAEALFS
ncbi:MAG: DUF559 domain-containing protein [Niabella sp.]